MSYKPKAQYIKRIRFNAVVCDVSGTPTGLPFASGGYIKVDQFYSEQFIADTTNILYETNGDSKIIEYDTLDEITNNQLFVSADKQNIQFYNVPLPPSSDCYNKARESLGFKKDAIDINGVMAIDQNDSIAKEA